MPVWLESIRVADVLTSKRPVLFLSFVSFNEQLPGMGSLLESRARLRWGRRSFIDSHLPGLTPGLIPSATEADSWGDVQLEAQNQLTLWLHNNAREEYRSWNNLAITHKAESVNLVTEHLRSKNV